MVFSSISFLFLFLPIVLAIYFLLPGIRLRNGFLLVMSLLFYALGEGMFVFLILASVTLNYGLGLWVDQTQKTGNRGQRRWAIATAVIGNIGLLIYFKYTNFLVDNFNALTAVGLQPIQLSKIHLPLGISFFTFHALSYVIDVYRGDAKPQKSLRKLVLYFTFFPQLVAGPIIRYHDVETQLSRRSVSLDDFTIGIRRFIMGLAKKVLIANTLGAPADQIMAIPSDQLTTSLAWLGIVCYTLQIYFDFSGYSDMAIGLARMFGFHFLENFNYPYISQSIKEFWRRWHISLSNWFRDYLYIPLGGNRGSTLSLYRNLLIVFLLCGFWHGASWNFLIWGLFHGGFLVLERLNPLKQFVESKWAIAKHLYTLLIVMIGWVFFRTNSLNSAISFLGAMAGFASGSGIEHPVLLYLNKEILIALVVGLIASTPILPRLTTWQQKFSIQAAGQTSILSTIPLLISGEVFLTFIFLLSLIKLAAGTYNPFIYFQF